METAASIVGGEAEQVAETVREKEGVGVAFDEASRVAAENSEVDEASRDSMTGREMKVPVLDPGPRGGDCRALDVENEAVEIALDAFEARPGKVRVTSLA